MGMLTIFQFKSFKMKNKGCKFFDLFFCFSFVVVVCNSVNSQFNILTRQINVDSPNCSFEASICSLYIEMYTKLLLTYKMILIMSFGCGVAIQFLLCIELLAFFFFSFFLTMLIDLK